MSATIGLTGPQRVVFRIVAKFPGLSAGELASIIHLHPSTITGIVQRLVARRLLRRDRDPDDSRRTRLWAEPAARRYTERRCAGPAAPIAAARASCWRRSCWR